MEHDTCAEVRRWVRNPTGPLPPEPLLRHIAVCPACCGALALLALEPHAAPGQQASIACDACRADLATFVEIEQLDGLAAAIEALPHVWSHLVTCGSCTETYRLTSALVEAERAPPFEPVAAAAREPRWRSVLRLTRAYLDVAMPPPAALAPMRGGAEGELVLIHEWMQEDLQISVYVREQPDRRWCVSVRVQPPPRGWLVLSLGEERYRAPLDGDGNAEISDVPAGLMAPGTGPDMEVGIEPEGADQFH